MSEISGGASLTLPSVTVGATGAVDNTITFNPSDEFEEGFFDALGRVTVAFGRLDYMLMIALKRLRQTICQREGQPPRDFNVVIAEDFKTKDFGPRTKRAKKLFCCVVFDSTQIQAFEKLVAEANQLWNRERNDNFHAYWTAAHDRTPTRIRPEKEKGTGIMKWDKSAPVPVATLRAIACHVEDLANELNRATGEDRLGAAPPNAP